MIDVLIGVGFIVLVVAGVWLQGKILTPQEQQDFVDGMDEFLYGDIYE